jgi:uncharacterized membrane protein YbjE (DUF340 family)
MAVTTDFGIWAMALCTFGIYSFFWKENPVYRFLEYTAVSATLGVYVTNAIKNVRNTAINPLMAGDLIWIVPLIISFLWYTRFIPKYRWVSRYPMALTIGVAFGIAVVLRVNAELLGQVVAVVLPWFSGDLTTNAVNIVVTTGLCALGYYFIFTREPKYSVERWVNQYARIVLMVGLGGVFAGWISGRMTAFLAQLEYLLVNWLGVA